MLVISMSSPGTVFADFCEQHHGPYLGDVNDDAVIDMEDVRDFARQRLGRIGPGPEDIDLDGSITGDDLALLVQGAHRRQGLALEVRDALYCCPNPYGCPVVAPLPRARVEARIEGRVVSRTMTDSLGNAFLLLPPGTFDVVIYPPAGVIDGSLTATQVHEGLTTIRPAPYAIRFEPREVLVRYDVAYPWERILEILAEQEVASWHWIYPGFPWLVVVLPDCLHTLEVLETWRTYPEILSAEPNDVGCVQ
jgi:hypothetical protein